ncbi:MAG: hypothetical protein ACXWXS_09760 [Actinomycetota bacterium]
MTFDATIGWMQDLFPILGVVALALTAKLVLRRTDTEPLLGNDDVSGLSWYGRSWSARSWS